STRIQIENNTELGRLALGFNEMASTIEDYSLNLEKQVDERSKQLLEAEKMASIGSLVAGFAHEMNTPISTGIIATTHLTEQVVTLGQMIQTNSIKRSQLTHFLSECQDATEILNKTLSNAGKLVSSFKVVMLDQSRNEAGDIAFKAYIMDIIASLKHEHKHYNLTFCVNCASSIILHCDPAHLYQIFNNLILNSLRHGLNKFDPSEIKIDIKVECNQLIIQFRDNGVGIHEEILARVFEPFFTTKRDKGGSGIGLPVVANVVQNMFNGTIKCTSDGGAIFTILLPTEDLLVT
ncbi:MAG: signal transduction histidine kinase, partial [Oleiphilaceae bacterium]